MKGKADKLVANRTLSALVVLCVVLSAFAGFAFLIKPASIKAAAIGDLTITNSMYTIENTIQPVDGNVTVDTGGTLLIKDATMTIISNSDSTLRHHVTVQNGGKLILNHGVITTYLDQIDPWPFLALTVTNFGNMTSTGNSLLAFPGFLNVTSNGVVSLTDTIVTSLDSGYLTQYYGSTPAMLDLANDGPAILVANSRLAILDSSILKLPEFPQEGRHASNLTLTGNSTLLSVDSYLSVDFLSNNVPMHNVLELRDLTHAYLYGTHFDYSQISYTERSPAIAASNSGAVNAIPASKGASDNTLGDLADLAAVDGATYQVVQARTMEINTWNVAGYADSLPVSSARLVTTYSVSPTYAGTAAVQWAREGTAYSDTSIIPRTSDPLGTTAEFSIPLASVPTVGDVRNMNVRFSNNGGAGTGYVEFDRLWIVFTVGSDAFIYRWLNATVGDEYGVPISGAHVTARFTGSSDFEGRTAVYYSPSGVSTTPPSDVLAYMGESASTFNVTKSDGVTVVPYLTDIITNSGVMQSLYVGSYSLTGNTTIGATGYRSTQNFSFPSPYPAMKSTDQSYEFTVSILGVSAQSPDTSRWLVVPPSLVISNMTYYHAGDVIVAADGTLRFYNAELQMIQLFANQRTVFVDNSTGHPAILAFEKSKMTSQLPINIDVQGHAVLKVMNSSLEGVNIVAHEHSTVIFMNSTMDGLLSTEWDAAANVIVKDSTLNVAPILSGTSIGEFTNTSVPSVTVQRDALAYIYRWIHVTVFDAAGKPLPGALISTRSYVDGTPGQSAYSSEAADSLGVAKVNSLATILSSAGPPGEYRGNYWVSGSYTYGGTTYPASQDISVGVMPYSAPLGKNATYATMTIPGTLPDLSVHQTTSPPYPVWTNNPNPLPGDNVTVYARIYNDGVSYAYNVQVNFYDDEQNTSVIDESRLFGSATAPMIRPGQYVDVLAYWTAGGLVAPNQHRLIVKIDPNRQITQPNASLVRTGYGFVTVQSLPDLYMFAGPEGNREITTSITPVVVNSTVTLIARVHNLGTLSVSNVLVNFSDDGAPIGSTTVSVSAGGDAQATIPWTPTMPKSHTILVQANPTLAFVELDYTNNNASVSIEVLDYPDLDLSAMSISPAGSVPGGDTVIVRAALKNLNRAPVSNPSGLLIVEYAGTTMAPIPWQLSGVTLTDLSGSVEVAASFTAPFLTARTDANLTLIVNPDHVPTEATYSNNLLESVIAILDVRPDLSIIMSDTVHDIYVQKGIQNVTSEMYGRQLTVYALVHNLGGSNATSVDIQVGLRNAANTYNHTLHRGFDYAVSSMPTNNTLKIAVPWTLNLTAIGQYQIWVWIDQNSTISEPDKTNNFAYANFTVIQLNAVVSITTDAAEYKAGDMMVISAAVAYNGTNEAVKNLPGVVFWLVDSTTNVRIDNSNSSAETTGPDGSMVVLLRIPTDLPTGSYKVRAVVGGVNYDSEKTIHVSAAVSGGGFLPLWVWILIIVAAVGIVAGFFVYTYVYGLGKLVECGECGAFIPAASKRCPKCGVEFEAGTMKCSECGAWIPAASTECPNCGVKFVGEAEEEADYMERMRKEYDDMVSKYRELAKPELGKKYSEKAFDTWWKAQPGYIAFEDWLAKEEEKKKEGPVPCPVCGTLNPKEATVCHKCGTVFGAATKAAPPAEKGPPPAAPPEGGAAPAEKPAQAAAPPPVVAPRMVIRRPIDRKVVPKKIIKTPLGTEEKEGEEKEEENNQ